MAKKEIKKNKITVEKIQDNAESALNGSEEIKKVSFPSFKSVITEKTENSIDILMDIPMKVVVELGKTVLKIKDILELGPGSIIELDKLSGEPVDILVNGRQIAKGEVVVIDENFGIRISDVVLEKDNEEKVNADK